MEFRLLGPLGVQAERQEVALGGPRQRLLLALLLLRANEVVTADQLVDDVWGDEPPNAARSSLYAYVSRLRKAIGPDRLVDGPGGYVLRAADHEVDARRFEAALADARHQLLADPGRAAIVLDEALALWRGAPLADLADEAALQPEIARLGELRLSALETRVEAGLALGRHDEQIGALEGLLAREPLRERAWGQLMVALYRSGRQGDALDAYLRARSVLADELGVDPSPELERLQRRILEQDPGLDTSGRRVRGYELRERIGSGAFGIVFRAIQPELGREVAVKVAHERLANAPDFIRRFDREAQLIAQLEHPHIVPLYDYWREPGGAYLVMRYLRGGSLRERIAGRGRLPDDEALRVVDQVALALGTAHRSGIVHRDVRPPNILFDEDGNAYLSDFGIARQVTASAAGEAGSSDPAYYVSPEEITGGAVTPASDVYSLGLVVFEMLSGRHPFAETPPDALISRHLRGRLPSLAAIRPDLPSGVEQVVRRATARRPTARFQDAQALAAAFRAVLEGVTEAPERAGEVRNPFKGLQPFREADAADFFGREALTARLVARLGEPVAEARFLAVVGPSGSGKSSVVRAGLIPRLRTGALPGSERWFVVEMQPGSRPFEELAEALLRVAGRRPASLARRLAGDPHGLIRTVDELLPDAGGELLLFVDQFEELFTLTPSEEDRLAFLDTLSSVAAHGSRVRVVLTLRADFFDRPLLHRVFGDLLAARTEAVAPMSTAELERAVIGPAEGVGLHLEPALMAEILADTGRAPGSLPLLQHALTELVERRQDGTLTLASYREIGGVPGGLARRAEQLVARLDRGGREAVRQVFLRLVTVADDGTADVRRRVLRSELEALDLATGAVPAVLDRFGRHRLLAFDRDPASRSPTVEVSHEALLREWGRLRGWIESAREDVLAHRRLASALAEWQGSGEDASFLLRGSRLEQLEGWAVASGISLTAGERAFLEASAARRDEERAAEEARRTRETALERRSRWRLRALAGVMALAAVIAVGLSLYAFDQQRQADTQARLATARERAAAAAANLEADPELAILLALEAVSTTLSIDGSVLPEAEEILHRAVGASRIVASLPGTGGSVAWSPDGSLFAVAGAEPVIELEAAPAAEPTIVTLYDASGAPIRSWDAGAGNVNGVRFSPDGRTLVTAGDDGAIRAWDAGTGSLIQTLAGPSGSVWGLSFSHDGTRVAGLWLEPVDEGPYPSSALIFDVAGGRLLQTIPGLEAGDGSAAQRTAFDADGARLAIATMADSSAEVYDVRTGQLVGELAPADPTRDPWGWSEVAWSPDGRLLAAAQANYVRIYDGISLRYLYMLSDHVGWITKLDWSADGSRLLTASADGTARLWRIDREAGRTELVLAGHVNGVTGAALTRDGVRALTADAEGTVRIWDTGPSGDAEWLHLPGEDVWFSSVIYGPDGRTILGGVPGGRTAIWDAETGEELLTLVAHEPAPDIDGVPGVAAIAVSPDGRLVATGGRDATVRVWDMGTGQQLEVLRVEDWVEDVRFSPDGLLLVVAEGWSARVFDVTSWHLLRSMDHDGSVVSTTFSANGRLLVTGSWDGTVRAWDPETGAEMRRIDVGWRVADIDLGADGQTVGVGGDGGAGIWSLETGDRLTTLVGHSAQVLAVRFTPDGRHVATGSVDGTIRLWDRATGVATLVLHDGGLVSGLAFSRDGSRLASISTSIRVWVLSIDELIEVAQENVTRRLSDAECRQYLHLDACPVDAGR